MYVPPYIHFLSLVELECWLVDVADDGIPPFKTLLSKVFSPRFFPQTLLRTVKRVLGPDYIAPWAPGKVFGFEHKSQPHRLIRHFTASVLTLVPS